MSKHDSDVEYPNENKLEDKIIKAELNRQDVELEINNEKYQMYKKNTNKEGIENDSEYFRCL